MTETILRRNKRSISGGAEKKLEEGSEGRSRKALEATRAN
jgi:hypothetical protein